MRTREFHVSSGSEYGRRVADQEEEKKAIARAVRDRVLWPEHQNAKNPVLFTDGSSTSYSWCYYLREWVLKGTNAEPLTVYTNNLDVPMQVLCEPNAPGRFHIKDAPGSFSFKYCANFGSDTEAWVREHAIRCTCVMAVTSLDAELGPGSKDPEARAIKRAIMETANVLVIVADRTKLGKKRDPSDAASPEAWRIWRDERSRDGRVFVVTDLTPGVTFPYKRSPFRSFPDVRTAIEIENENAWWLREALGDQFIIVR